MYWMVARSGPANLTVGAATGGPGARGVLIITRHYGAHKGPAIPRREYGRQQFAGRMHLQNVTGSAQIKRLLDDLRRAFLGQKNDFARRSKRKNFLSGLKAVLAGKPNVH